MIEFKGFPNRMQFTPIPNIVFSSLMPQITDILELKVLLFIFELVYSKKGNLRFVSFDELLNESSLMSNIKEPRQGTLQKILESLIQKRAILPLTVNKGDSAENIYFLNSEANSIAIEKIRKGELVLPGIISVKPVPVFIEKLPDIFTLYEENIGMLTPLIADELKEAVKQYPETWIRDAIRESVEQNKRNWKYIARILEHWLAEGKDDGAYRRHLKTNTDPDKYVKGKYGHMVQR